jgi:hypothetical protein
MDAGNDVLAVGELGGSRRGSLAQRCHPGDQFAELNVGSGVTLFAQPHRSAVFGSFPGDVCVRAVQGGFGADHAVPARIQLGLGPFNDLLRMLAGAGQFGTNLDRVPP